MLKTFRTLRCFTHDDYGDCSKELFNELWVLYSSRYDFYGKWIFGTGCVFHRVVLGPATWNGDVIHLQLRWPRPRLRPRSYILTKYTRRNSRWIGLHLLGSKQSSAAPGFPACVARCRLIRPSRPSPVPSPILLLGLPPSGPNPHCSPLQ